MGEETLQTTPIIFLIWICILNMVAMGKCNQKTIATEHTVFLDDSMSIDKKKEGFECIEVIN